MNRCFWVNQNNERYIKYHDNEWGKPSHDDQYLFEMLVLEAFQAGLSWETILNKREAFRIAFDGFDAEKMSKYDEDKITELMNNPGIIRYRAKIEAAINNARVFLQIQRDCGSFSAYLWAFSEHKVVLNEDGKMKTVSPLSDAIAKDLKKRGMKFLGSTTVYAYLQGVGVINDHDLKCDFRLSQTVK